MKNISNYITISRILMSIILLTANTFSIPFYILYIFCGVSDILDGYLARKYKITSEIGAKLDSIADTVFVLVCLVKILPVLNIVKEIWICIVLIIIIKVFNIILGFIYHKKLILLHTVANKITGFMLFIAPLIIGVFNINILGILVCCLAMFSAIQEGYYIKIKNI